MCAHIWVLNTQSLQLWYSSLKKKKVSDTSAQTMKSKRIFMIYIWSCVWQVFFAGFLFVDSSGCFHTCFVFLFFLAVCLVSISLKWSVAGGHCAEAFGGCVKTSIVTVGCAMYFLNEPKSRHCRRRSWFANQSDPLLGLNEGKQQEH